MNEVKVPLLQLVIENIEKGRTVAQSIVLAEETVKGKPMTKELMTPIAQTSNYVGERPLREERR